DGDRCCGLQRGGVDDRDNAARGIRDEKLLAVRREKNVARSDETGESGHEAFGLQVVDLYARFEAIARNGAALIRADGKRVVDDIGVEFVECALRRLLEVDVAGEWRAGADRQYDGCAQDAGKSQFRSAAHARASNLQTVFVTGEKSHLSAGRKSRSR